MKAQRTTSLFAAAALAVAAGFAQPVEPARADGKITAANWTESVGFKPDVSSIPFKPGEFVSKSNVSKLKGKIPDGLYKLITEYNLKMRVAPYRPIHPSKGYIEATNKNRGKTKVKDVGKDYRKSGRNDHFAGLPFPKPKNALEIMTNFVSRYGGDDYEVYYDMLWISGKSGLEHHEYWHLASVRAVNRTDLEPIPRIKELTDKGFSGITYTEAIEPYDKKGFGALYASSLEPVDIQGHVYVPAMRRVLRNSFGTRGDAWNATDYLYEDVGGYLGAVEWMNWKFEGKTTMLMPGHPGVKHGKDPKVAYDLDNPPHWNPKADWEPRPVYLMSATPKIQGYPYSKMKMVIDAETYNMYYKEAYDKKGELWKIILSAPQPSRNADKEPAQWGFGCAIDLQSEHASCVHPRKARANHGQDLSQFTVSALRKRGH